MPGKGAERLSVIVPTLNEAERVEPLLSGLSALRRQGHEVIVVDGGSTDGTAQQAKGEADRVIIAPRGRARQMNAGADRAQGGVVLFLHADTVLPADADRLILSGLDETGRGWGRFDVAIDGRHPLLPVIAWFMNRRSRLTGIATGDQGIFVRRELFRTLGGFPDQPLMEDIELSKRLLRTGPPLCLPQPVVTSGRRWETRGVWRTMVLMWRLRWLYWRGVPPERLAALYR
jgi:rSAM/selenodomain-associated transferase 2